LGNDTSSITHTSGMITWDSRSAIRRRTGSGSHGDWFTNCCRDFVGDVVVGDARLLRKSAGQSDTQETPSLRVSLGVVSGS
jgi:hypothetical protein